MSDHAKDTGSPAPGGLDRLLDDIRKLSEDLGAAASPAPSRPRGTAHDVPAPAAVPSSPAAHMHDMVARAFATPEHAAPEEPPRVEETPPPTAEKADVRAVAERLLVIMSRPDSEATAQERALAADLLCAMLEKLPCGFHRLLVDRLCMGSAAHPALAVRLAELVSDDLAERLIMEAALPDPVLLRLLRLKRPFIATAIARRADLSAVIAAAVAMTGDAAAIGALLRNRGARLGPDLFPSLLRVAEEHPPLRPLLASHADLPPKQAMALFWHLDAAGRRLLLKRICGGGRSLKELLDIATNGRPAAVPRERLHELEGAIGALALGDVEGAIGQLRTLSGLDEALLRRIATDGGGEPLIILMKVLGYPRALLPAAIARLASSPASPFTRRPDPPDLQALFDALANDTARLAVLYWDSETRSQKSEARR
ncbi:MAG TPA: DUF2336 domain-containing protein [Thermopetrobacter sp.]|nr:DUF2336 domain-containing protein [Thermopetrobacter sp.]